MTTWTEEGRACARCGTEAYAEDCEWCPATGWYDDNDPNCHACHGSGIHWFCGSSPEWCDTHPRPGCEDAKRGTFEDWSVEMGSDDGLPAEPEFHDGNPEDFT